MAAHETNRANVLVFGAGGGGSFMQSKFSSNIDTIGITDNDEQKWGTVINGLEVLPPKEALLLAFDYVLIASVFEDEIQCQLLDNGIAKDKIACSSHLMPGTLFPPRTYGDAVYDDLRNLTGPSNRHPKCILDLGSFWGETALEFSREIPESEIHAFEPTAASYQKLLATSFLDHRIKPLNLAVGEQSGEFEFHCNRENVTNSLLRAVPESKDDWGDGFLEEIESQTVRVTTIDSYLRTCGIESVDLLKMDVQGAETLVFKGASRSFKNKQIQNVLTEIIIHPSYHKQSSMTDVLKTLDKHGFRLVNLYTPGLLDGRISYLEALFSLA